MKNLDCVALRLMRGLLAPASLSLVLGACGGGGGGDASPAPAPAPAPSPAPSPSPSPSPAPAPAPAPAAPVVDNFTATWVQNFCAVGNRNLVVANRSNDTTLAESTAIRQYATTACGGSASDIGLASAGTVVFSALETSGGYNFARGTWTNPLGQANRVIWGFKPSGLLCILGDTNPSSMPDAASVAAALAIQPDLNCYQKQ